MIPRLSVRIVTILALALFWQACNCIDARANPAEDAVREGNKLRDERKYDEAIKEYTVAISLDPKMVFACEGRASAYLNLRQWQKTIDDCSEAIKLNPKDAAAFAARGNALKQIGNLKSAIDDFTQASDIDPWYPYFAERAEAYLEIKQKEFEARRAPADKAHHGSGQYWKIRTMGRNCQTIYQEADFTKVIGDSRERKLGQKSPENSIHGNSRGSLASA